MAGEGLMLLIGTLRSASFTASSEVTSLPLGMGVGKEDALALQKLINEYISDHPYITSA
jgi:hypothetical protein